jgi:hypothetical protein
MSITTEKMKQALIKYINERGYKGTLQFSDAGDYVFININNHLFPEITKAITITVAGSNPNHLRKKEPYLKYCFEGTSAQTINYDPGTNLDDFIKTNMDKILPPQRPSPRINRNPIERIERLEKIQREIKEATARLNATIEKLESRVQALEAEK